MGRLSFAALLGLALTAPVSGALAQVITGTVLQSDSVTPAGGVLVEIRAGAAGDPIRALTTVRGMFRVTLPAPDTARVRVLRPGFRPVAAAPVFVASGAVREIRIVLGDQPVMLATVKVRETRVCGERADANAWQLWEQARTVLQTTALTERDTALTVRTLEFEGQATPGGATIVQDSTIRFVPVEAEFPPAHYDSLFRFGYIRRDAGNITTYYAPNAKVLLDERFVTSHCFRIAERDSTPPGMIGVRFEPIRASRQTGILGTFWLDSATFLLRQIEFGYINPPRDHHVPGTGGFVAFARLSTGHWIMSEWSIRMASLIVRRQAWTVEKLENGTWRRRHPLTRPQGYVITSDYNLWSRNQMVVSVHLGQHLLFAEPAGDTLALRLVPMRPGDPRLPVRP